jgi:hypothetical protein
MNRITRSLTCAAAALALTLAGCGTPGAPQPPSLKLPALVTDLGAVRAGSQVTLTWTMPKRDTAKIALKGDVPATICRQETTSRAGAGSCISAGTVSVAPGAKGTFVDTLPPALANGTPRALTYSVELKNRHGRSAGQSNTAVVLAGEAPAPVTGFAAALHKDGVAFHWTVPGNGGDSAQSIRLYRKLLNTAPKKQDSGPLAAPKEPAESTLLVDSDTGRALDSAVEFNSAYEYRAQRIARVQHDGSTLELAGELSAPVRITVEDIFPPSVPSGLAAVATAASAATPTSPAMPAAIDLSWLPATDRNLAGYVVYRREGDGPWQRISPAQPAVIGPAFHDAEVQPGHTYRYAVASISPTGHESARSAEAEETVPAP